MIRDKRRGRGRRFLWALLVVAVGWLGVATFRIGAPPSIEIVTGLPGIGRRTEVRVAFEEPGRGLSRFEVQLVQGDRVERLVEETRTPRAPWALWGPATEREEVVVAVGSETIDGLTEGEARIRALAWRAGTWLRKPDPVVQELVLPVRFTPPSVHVRSSQHYVVQGGSGVVVYTVGEGAVRHGVQVGERWFSGRPLAGGGERRQFALFAIPYDLDEATAIRLVAEDDVRNRILVPFVDQLFTKSFRADTIEVSESFMARVVPAIMSATPGFEDQGELLANYLWINSELRARNAGELVELAGRSQPDFLWNRPFLSMSSGQVMSSFADRRTYLFQGRKVDQQDHLGFDLASVRQAEIESSNRGVVVLARYFGIYGNAVVVDHGHGLMSLYGHLSSLAVEQGQSVERGQILGRSGETGLAGGDHLHFTLLIQGYPVNPMEWWDPAWIRDRFAAKLAGSFAFEP